MFNIEEELKKLPSQPGVYLMHDAKDEIIYVGKAISLKNRVRQYFQSSRNKTAKIQQMVSRIARFEYIVTDSELEALVLECNLIKEHQPRYNTMLKDDKAYPYIKVTVGEDFPRVMTARSDSFFTLDEKGQEPIFWSLYERRSSQGHDRSDAEDLSDSYLQPCASAGHRKGSPVPELSYRTVRCPVSGKNQPGRVCKEDGTGA